MAIQGFLMAILTFVYVAATILLVRVANHANSLSKKNVEELTKIEKERLRPLVEARLDSDAPFIVLRVSNQGQTPAYSLAFEINPELQQVLGGDGCYPSSKSQKPIGIVERGIGSLGAGASETAIVGTFSRIKEVYPQMRFTGNLHYKNGSGTEYSTPIDLDIRYMEGSLHVHHKTLHEVANELENIRREIGHIGSGFHELKVITKTAEQKRAEDDAFVADATATLQEMESKAAQQDGSE